MGRRLRRGDRVLAAGRRVAARVRRHARWCASRSRSSLILLVALIAGRARCVAARAASIRAVGLGFVDRFLGAVFGVARGVRRRAGLRAGRGAHHPAASRIGGRIPPLRRRWSRPRCRSAPGCRRHGPSGSIIRRRGRTLRPALGRTGRSHVRNHRRRRAHAGQPAALRRAAAAAASRPGRRGHRHQRRRDVSHAQGTAATCATCSARATCATSWARRHRPLPLSDRGLARPPSSNRSRSTSTRRSASRSAHNGNLTNSEALKRELFQLDFRHVNTNSDSRGAAQRAGARARARRASRAARRRTRSSRRWPACTGAAAARTRSSR